MNYIILYGGKLCESRLVSSQGDCTLINFYAHYGTELPDRDSGLFAGHSDPYVRVVAYRSRGSSKSLQTSQHTNNGSPEWNQWLDFGVDRWTRFTVQVYDEDSTRDHSLSSVSTYHLSSHTTRTNVL